MPPETAPPPAAEAWIDDLLAQADAAEAQGAFALATAMLLRAAQATRAPSVRRRAGLALARDGRMAEAADALRSALVASPADAEVRHALGLALLALGRGPEGAALAEARFDLPRLGARKPAGFPYPEWRGGALAGKRLALFPELSLGDQLLASRYVPKLQAEGVAITLFCPPSLTRLFADSFPGAAIVAATGEVQFEDPDAWTMITSLHVTLRPGSAPPAPALRAAAENVRRGRRIALAPGALPAKAAARLAAVAPEATIMLSAESDLPQVAAQMCACDLVISADPDLTQLASGLSRPTLALAPAHDVHWSLAVGGRTQAWHPTVEVFRAGPGGQWGAAIERVAQVADRAFSS